MKDNVVIKQSFSKQLGLSFLVLLLFLASFFGGLTQNNPVFIALGIVCALFFGVYLVFMIKRLTMPKIILVIDSSGFIDNSSVISSGKMVFWNEVKEITISSFATQKFICVDLLHPQEYYQSLSPAKRLLVKANCAFSFHGIQITLASTTAKYEDVFEIMKRYLSVQRAE